jgi:hypothetical protein
MVRLEYLLAATALTLGLLWTTWSMAGGPWSNQYCNLKTETVIVKDALGNIVTEDTVEKLVCDDGRKDFLQYSGIAKSCREFWYEINLNGAWINKRGYVCQKFDGSWEIVKSSR